MYAANSTGYLEFGHVVFFYDAFLMFGCSSFFILIFFIIILLINNNNILIYIMFIQLERRVVPT